MSSFTSVLFIFLVQSAPALSEAFDHNICRSRALETYGKTEITREQCKSLCGRGYGSYGKWVAFSQITNWVIPLFLLVGNMNNASSQLKCRSLRNLVFIASHLLADPIDTIFSLLFKIDTIRRFYNDAKSMLQPPESNIDSRT